MIETNEQANDRRFKWLVSAYNKKKTSACGRVLEAFGLINDTYGEEYWVFLTFAQAIDDKMRKEGKL